MLYLFETYSDVKHNIKEVLKNRTRQKKKHVFLVFLAIAVLASFLTKLSSEYESTVVYSVAFENLPKSKLFQSTPDNKLPLRIKATGFKLLGENINPKKMLVSLQGIKYKNKYTYYLTTNNIKQQLQNQLHSGLKVISVEKDTLFFDLGLNKAKKIPVIANVSINYKFGYDLNGAVITQPDSVVVRGPEFQVNQLSHITMNELILNDVYEDVFYEVDLDLPENLDRVQLDDNKVKIIAKVEKFTEGSFKVPFYVDGLPPGASITTYPKTIKVVFKVGNQNYSKISPADFSIRCDYNKTVENGLKYLVPELITKSKLVSSVKMHPNQVEFLIQK